MMGQSNTQESTGDVSLLGRVKFRGGFLSRIIPSDWIRGDPDHRNIYTLKISRLFRPFERGTTIVRALEDLLIMLIKHLQVLG